METAAEVVASLSNMGDEMEAYEEYDEYDDTNGAALGPATNTSEHLADDLCNMCGDDDSSDDPCGDLDGEEALQQHDVWEGDLGDTIPQAREDGEEQQQPQSRSTHQGAAAPRQQQATPHSQPEVREHSGPDMRQTQSNNQPTQQHQQTAQPQVPAQGPVRAKEAKQKVSNLTKPTNERGGLNPNSNQGPI